MYWNTMNGSQVFIFSSMHWNSLWWYSRGKVVEVTGELCYYQLEDDLIEFIVLKITTGGFCVLSVLVKACNLNLFQPPMPTLRVNYLVMFGIKFKMIFIMSLHKLWEQSHNMLQVAHCCYYHKICYLIGPNKSINKYI